MLYGYRRAEGPDAGVTTMTSISASAAAGLLVALLVATTTHDSLGAPEQPVAGNDLAQAGSLKRFDPQPDPPKLLHPAARAA